LAQIRALCDNAGLFLAESTLDLNRYKGCSGSGTATALASEGKIMKEGIHPLFKLDTSSESHPFYTGTQKSVDNMGGRVERFRNRFGKK
jgi:ribosomal protein L31